MTRLALCRKCRKIFFTNIRGKHSLQCPQRDCRSRDVINWSAILINEVGSEILYDILPKPPEAKSRKRPPKPPVIITPPESEYQYCLWASRGCINPEKKTNEDGSCIKNKLRDDCLLLPDKESQ